MFKKGKSEISTDFKHYKHYMAMIRKAAAEVEKLDLATLYNPYQ